MNHVAEEFRKTEGIDLRTDAMALQRLKEAAEKAKCELSQQMEATINLPFITADQQGPKHLQLTITRAKFESLCEDLFDRLKRPCEIALSDGKIKPGDITDVVMVGGSTRIPKVQAIAKAVFGTEELDKSMAKYHDVREQDFRHRERAGQEPDFQEGNLLHRVGQPDIRDHSRPSGRA